jgi:uncharacterized membrane protein
MTAIEQSRLWVNLRRDLRNKYRQDESLSIMNASGADIEITDTHTGVTKIVYPRSVFHTNRPLKNIIITQGQLKAEIPRSTIKKDMITVETPIKYRDSLEDYADLLNMNWVNKVMKSSDRIIITRKSYYYIIVDVQPTNYLVILLLIMLIALCAIGMFL